MYNQLFTDTWKMDRCIEGSWIGSTFLNPYTLAILLTVLLFCGLQYFRPSFEWLSKPLKKRFHFTATAISQAIFLAISIVGGIVLALPAMAMVFTLAIIIGFLVMNCSFGPLWQRVQPAHEMHARLKNIRQSGDQVPRSLEEFIQIHPEAYEKIEGKAEIKYEYMSERNGYHFSVRPSRYLIADFSDEDDFVLYRTESVISPHIFRANPLVK